jgi:Terminase RNaseH-like domain
MSTTTELDATDIDLGTLFSYKDSWQIVADVFDPPAEDNDGFKGWVPFPKQLEATKLAEIADELLFGGAAGPGKTEWLMEYAIREMERWPGNRGCIFRRVMPSLRKSVIPRLRAKLEPTGRAVWNENEKVFKFPNTSILEIGSVQFREDVMNYNGAEYGFMGFEEVTEFLPYQYEYLLGRLRAPATAAEGLRPHVVCTTNPGGANHSYYKKRFVKPPKHDLPDPEDELAPPNDPFTEIELPPGAKTIPPCVVWRPRGIPGTHTPEDPPLTRCFVPATHVDNPMLLRKSPNYLSQLRAQSNRGLRKAMEEGDWDAIEQIKGALWNGADLDEGRINPKRFREEIEPNSYLLRVVAVDPSSGRNDAFAVTVASKDIVTGQVYVEDCLYLNDSSPRKMAEFALRIYKKVNADVLVVERNHGGDWMMDTFKEVDKYANIKDVWASKGKMTRAQPVASLFEYDEGAPLTFRARIVGNLPELEEELTSHSFDEENENAKDSPDGLDSMVWAISYLIDDGGIATRHNAGSRKDNRLKGRR